MRSYNVILTAVTPVHVGSGVSYSKKEYYFDERSRTVTLLDMNKIMAWIIAQKRDQYINDFETFMFSRRDNDIRAFLRRLRMPEEKIKDSEIFSFPAGDAFAANNNNNNNNNKRDLKAFIRNARGLPYIPGSSLKGALRTVILVGMLLKRRVGIPEIYTGEKKFVKGFAGKIECNLLHTLGRDARKTENARNSIMSGLSISDSLPFAQEKLMIAAKTDIFTDGRERTLPIFRECAAPGTDIVFRMTVSREAEDTADADALRSAVAAFCDHYAGTYAVKFPKKYGTLSDDCIFLGGGSGYFSKNIVYPRYSAEREKALRTVSDIMTMNFKKHNHEKDIGLGISPRALKCAYAGGRMQQMGICRIRFEETE